MEHQADQDTIGHGEHSGSGAIDGPVDAGPLAGLPEPPEGPPSPLTSEDGGQEEHGIRWWLAPEPEEAPTNASSATQELQEVTSDGVKAAIPRPVVEVDHRIGHDEPIEPSTGSSSLPLIAAAVVIVAVIGYLVL